MSALRVLSNNGRYFTDGSGRAILLAGSHTWSNGMEDRGTINPPPAFDYEGYLRFMKAHNFNWMRMWTSEMSRVSKDDDPSEDIIAPPFKWLRTGPGLANDGDLKFDFTRLNQSYFDRMRSRIIQAGQNGVYVSVMLFNGYMWKFDANSTDGNPFESATNVNGISCEGTCPSSSSQIPAAAWRYEQTYLAKLIDTVSDLPNVMYEASNEAGWPNSNSWQENVIRYVERYESKKGIRHPIGITCEEAHASDAPLYDSLTEWISPCTRIPADATGRRVVINDTDHSFSYEAMKRLGQAKQMEWAWENFAHGNNLAFMDPYLVRWAGRNACTGQTADPDVCTGLDPYWDVMRNAMTDVRNYATKIDLAHMTPQDSLSSTGFCLASPGSQYLVFDASGGGHFYVEMQPGDYSYEWFNPVTHQVVQTGKLAAARKQNFVAPFAGDSVLWLRKMGAL